MNIVMTLLVRDEADILAANLDYHLAQGVDFFIVTDHHSTDRTPDILRHFEQRKLVEFRTETDPGYRQGEWVTSMARRAAVRYGADWVINNDVDEFWWPLEGTLRSTLEAVPASCGMLSAPRHNFGPVADERGRFYDRMTFRDVESTNAFGRRLPPKVCHRGVEDVVVAQGNHVVTGSGLDEPYDDEAIVIFHYPLRTYRQFARKIVSGGRAYRQTPDLPPNVGSTWRMLYELYEAGDLRDYYEDSVLTNDVINRRLADGSLVQDERLRDFFGAQVSDTSERVP